MDRLQYLAHLYFHQDWDLEASTPIDALRNYRREEPIENVQTLRDELMQVLAPNPDEAQLAEAWSRAGADWDPRAAQWGTYREWFDAMLAVMR